MGWIMHEYSKYTGFSPSVVNGKPLDPFGSEGQFHDRPSIAQPGSIHNVRRRITTRHREHRGRMRRQERSRGEERRGSVVLLPQFLPLCPSMYSVPL
jgi:hypothetical protein